MSTIKYNCDLVNATVELLPSLIIYKDATGMNMGENVILSCSHAGLDCCPIRKATKDDYEHENLPLMNTRLCSYILNQRSKINE